MALIAILVTLLSEPGVAEIPRRLIIGWTYVAIGALGRCSDWRLRRTARQDDLDARDGRHCSTASAARASVLVAAGSAMVAAVTTRLIAGTISAAGELNMQMKIATVLSAHHRLGDLLRQLRGIRKTGRVSSSQVETLPPGQKIIKFGFSFAVADRRRDLRGEGTASCRTGQLRPGRNRWSIVVMLTMLVIGRNPAPARRTAFPAWQRPEIDRMAIASIVIGVPGRR